MDSRSFIFNSLLGARSVGNDKNTRPYRSLKIIKTIHLNNLLPFSEVLHLFLKYESIILTILVQE